MLASIFNVMKKTLALLRVRRFIPSCKNEWQWWFPTYSNPLAVWQHLPKFLPAFWQWTDLAISLCELQNVIH